MAANDWCRALGISSPKLEAVVGHQEANAYSLLLVALLERGEPMTLAEVAVRFDEAGVAERSRALQSLQRCKPARPPVYRVGDLYHLDPHDDGLDLWAFRLGLRPPKAAPAPPMVAEPVALPGPETPLTAGELDEAWKDASLFSWSAQRLVIAVLDANGAPLAPAEVVAALAARTKWHGLREDAATKFARRGSAVDVLADGRWAVAADAGAAVAQARAAVRARVAVERRHAALRPDPALMAQRSAEWDKRRAAHGAELTSKSRALVVAFPPARPEAAALLDVDEREITTFVGEEFEALRSRLADYEILGGIEVRALLRALEFDPGERRLAELGPPQKSKKLNKAGRTLKITAALLVQGSCGISKPFGDGSKLSEYLANAEPTKLRRRLEADAKSLYALYEYGRLHGAVRLRWGFLDERIPAPWVHDDEPKLYDLKKAALAMNVPLEVVIGSAPGWGEPWSRAVLAQVRQEPRGWPTWLIDELGTHIPDADIQRARLSVTVH